MGVDEAGHNGFPLCLNHPVGRALRLGRTGVAFPNAGNPAIYHPQ